MLYFLMLRLLKVTDDTPCLYSSNARKVYFGFVVVVEEEGKYFE